MKTRQHDTKANNFHYLENIERVSIKDNTVIEIHMDSLTLEEQTKTTKSLYLACRNELAKQKKKQHEQKDDVYARKTYQIKESVAGNFALRMEAEHSEIGKCLTELMSYCIERFDSNKSIPMPALYEANANYEKKSYRIKNTVAQKFKQFCETRNLPIGLMVQALIEEYLNSKT